MVAKDIWVVKATKYANWPCAAFSDASDAVRLAKAMHHDEELSDIYEYVELVPVFGSDGIEDRLMLFRHDAEIEQLQAVADMICEEMDAKDAFDSEVPDGE